MMTDRDDASVPRSILYPLIPLCAGAVQERVTLPPVTSLRPRPVGASGRQPCAPMAAMRSAWPAPPPVSATM